LNPLDYEHFSTFENRISELAKEKTTSINSAILENVYLHWAKSQWKQSRGILLTFSLSQKMERQNSGTVAFTDDSTAHPVKSGKWPQELEDLLRSGRKLVDCEGHFIVPSEWLEKMNLGSGWTVVQAIHQRHEFAKHFAPTDYSVLPYEEDGQFRERQRCICLS
jgi:hypothetical protein